MKRLVIGILAHVDAGKTTLSEGMLYQLGQVRKLGRVDHGDTFLDSHQLEKRRGITIFSKQALLRTDKSEFTLLDTPGHVDFSTEMERTLQVLDYAILVVSGADGVQNHTQTLWQLLIRYQIPTFLFINKMDLAGADRTKLLDELKSRLSDRCVDFSEAEPADAFAEALAMCDERLLEEYLDQGHIQADTLCSAIAKRQVFPCYFGSALKLQGIDSFLQGLEKYAVSFVPQPRFAAKVFKISQDEQGNRLTHVKITGGTLQVRQTLGEKPDREESLAEKVNQIRLYSGAKYQSVDQACPGMVCALTGLNHTYPGQGLGAEPDSTLPALEPVLTYRVELPEDTDVHTALSRLRLLEQEDPQLRVSWKESLGEIHVQLMGQVQLEILKSLIAERFGMQVRFGAGNILYKETIAAPVEGVGHFEPLRHYAEVHLLLEPGKPGSGLRFASDCREDDLERNWQRLILTHLQEKTHLGVLTGSPLTDVKITLIAGRAHEKHTEGGDFRQATYRAVRQGLKMAKSVLLEPWYTFRLEAPAPALGRAMSDLQRMEASFEAPQSASGSAVLCGRVPAATIRDYQTQLIQYTRGQGRLFLTLAGYAPCHNSEAVIAASGYDSDSDLDNPADSVFCAHGAGFVVKWDRVREYMHLDTGILPPAAAAEQTLPKKARQAEAFRASLEEDKELLAIFERTYGPIRRDPRLSFRPVKKEADRYTSHAPKLPSGPEYVLVDGYNVIFAWDDLRDIAKKDLDAARGKLIDMLCNYQGFCRCEVILVFDAYRVKGNPGEVEKVHNITVVYTKEAETADVYIEKATHELGRKYRVRVATSDGLEQLIILSHGALRVSAAAFREEVNQVDQAIKTYLLCE